MYTREVDLMDDFMAILNDAVRSPWGVMPSITEFNYTTGRADVVIMIQNGHLIAFEGKLKDWRCALHQAYRNTFYAHQSYVVLPERTASYVQRYTAAFERRSIGLCMVKDGEIHILIPAPEVEPPIPSLSKRARKRLEEAYAHEPSADCERNLPT